MTETHGDNLIEEARETSAESAAESLEKPEVIGRSIKAKIAGVQFEFAQRLHEDTGQPLGSVLEKYTCAIDDYGWRRDDDETRQKRAEIKTKVLEMAEIEAANWPGLAAQLLQKEQEIWESSHELPNDPSGRAGEFTWIMQEFGDNEAQTWQMRPGDNCLELHFPIRAIEAAKGNKQSSLRASMAKLAEVIVKEHPETQAVTGRSWMMSHPVAEKLGFVTTKIYNPEENGSFKHPSYWFQLLDQKGNLKQEEVEYLYQHKRLRLDESCGKIDVESFLQMYLPKKMRGEITLLEPSDESRDMLERIDKEGHALQEAWGEITLDNIDGVLARFPTVMEMLRESGQEARIKEAILKFKESGASFEDFAKNRELAEISQALHKKVRELRCKPRSVTIE
jgi:hypothetical protein